MKVSIITVFVSLVLAASQVLATPDDRYRPEDDWLVRPAGFTARITEDKAAGMLVLENGLVRRSLKLGPNAATVAYDNLMTGETLLRAIRPEAEITLDGISYAVGGLTGQGNQAFLPADLGALKPDPRALRYIGHEIGAIQKRLQWKRLRPAATAGEWPPKGRHLRLDFAMPPSGDLGEWTLRSLDSRLGRPVLVEDAFAELKAWLVHRSPSHPRSACDNEGKPGEIYTLADSACFIERTLPAATALVEASFTLGTDTSTSYGPGLVLLFGQETVKFNIRPRGGGYDTQTMFGAWAAGKEQSSFGGRQKLDPSGTWRLRMRLEGKEVICEARRNEAHWTLVGRLPRPSGKLSGVRLGKSDVAGGKSDAAKLVAGDEPVRLKLESFLACGALDAAGLEASQAALDRHAHLKVSVHYEIYDGLPLIAKWLSFDNGGAASLRLDAFSSEILALAEAESFDSRQPASRARAEVARVLPPLYVETDYAMGAMDGKTASAWSIQWGVDPTFHTQFNYMRQTPCLLRVSPRIGPARVLPPGGRFATLRAYELMQDSAERERQGLAQRRMYRVLAPWSQENPLMMHCTFSQPDKVKSAIDQAAECGFEMIILSFGSGFEVATDDPKRLALAKELAAYARSRGLEIGGYTLLSSRNIGGGQDNVAPPDLPEAHGNSPSLTSPWGQSYLTQLRAFYRDSGFTLLENDGPYPGDFDTKARPPLQQGFADSQYVQWEEASRLYADLRAQGIYINQPDWYFLSGGSKTGMGYREDNWSLPRAEQRLHTRQNIYDGTWEKTPSMGWMFVPLTQYHGGGSAATIEPLKDNLAHYELMLASNLLLGVQACYRGPRLYDGAEARTAVKKWVALYKKHRAILESDLIHLRRADGRDLDYMLHVNPDLPTKGFLAVFNPTEGELERDILVPLHYAGLSGQAAARINDGEAQTLLLDPRQRLRLKIKVPAQGVVWVTFEAAAPEQH
ncbi:MAG: hypothetical protein RL095_3869 [Verrucomicrobiota bacterium]|jgi:hypothetical protein